MDVCLGDTSVCYGVYHVKHGNCTTQFQLITVSNARNRVDDTEWNLEVVARKPNSCVRLFSYFQTMDLGNSRQIEQTVSIRGEPTAARATLGTTREDTIKKTCRNCAVYKL